jgi:hypothetical protein
MLTIVLRLGVLLSACMQVPFLSVGGELGWREVISRGVSELSGDYCVEDVRGEDGQLYRRLVFLSNAGLVQSEGRLISTEAGQFSSLVQDAVPYALYGKISILQNDMTTCLTFHSLVFSRLQ